MDKIKNTLALIGVAFIAGGFVVWFVMAVLGGKPTEVSVGPIKFDIPTPTIAVTSTEIAPTDEEMDVTETSSLAQVTSRRGSEIIAQGTIAIGVHHAGVYPISFPEGETYTGFEAELAIEIVKRLFGDQVKIIWVPLDASERFSAVENGSVDFLIRSTTHTILREDFVLFSRNYFIDGVRLLVRRIDGYESLEDMEGKTIVAGSEMFAFPIRDAASTAGIDVNILIDEDAKTVFLDGRADAVSTYWASHGLFVDDYSKYQAIDELFNREPFAIVISKSNPDFRDEIDEVLLDIIEALVSANLSEKKSFFAS